MYDHPFIKGHRAWAFVFAQFTGIYFARYSSTASMYCF